MLTPSDAITRSPLRVAVAAAVGLALVGALYLYVARGPALLMDLASGMAGLFCL